MEDEDESTITPSIDVHSSGEGSPIAAQPTSSLANQDEADPKNENTHESSAEKPTKARLTYHQKATFASAILASLANMLAFSVISVFYPIEAKSQGLSQTVIGLVFSAFAFSAGIGSPIWGKIIPVVGARFIFLAGSFVTGGCNILFGFVADMPTKATFTVFSFAIRLVEGLGTSATITSSAAIVAFAFPEKVGTAVSLIEMTSGLAYGLGPAIGGLLYDAGGFKLPFFTLGGFVLAVDVANFFLLPKQGKENEESGSLTRVLSIPAIWVTLLAVLVASICMGSIDPTLAIHLKALDFTVMQISFIFLGFGLVYAIFSLIWGAVADAKKATRIMIVLGVFGCAVFFLFLGPSPLLKINSTKLLAIIAVPVGSAMLSLLAMPTLVDMFISAKWYGIPSNLGLTSVTSGLWTGVFAIGTMIGPLLGGTLTETYGYALQTTTLACALLLVMIIICFFGVWEYRCGKGRRVPRSRLQVQTNSTDDDRRQLIPNNV